MEGSEQQSSPNTQIEQEQLGFQSSPPPCDSNPASNRDLPPSDDSIKQIVAQLQHLSLKEIVNEEIQSSDSVQSTDDEEIKLEQAIDEEIYHLTVKQAINEALQDESLKQAIDEEIASNQVLSEGVPGHALRRFIDEALECNLDKAETQTDGEGEVEVECENEPKGSPVLEVTIVNKDGWEGAVKDENKNVSLNGVDEWGDDGSNVNDKVKVEVEIDNYESNRWEYEKQGGNGWNEDRDENGVNAYEDYRSENGKEEGYNENENENVGGDSDAVSGSKDGRQRRYHYPLRPDAEDCSYYMKTGTCKFGSNCKFNHPLRRKNQFVQATKETVKQREDSSERPEQTECKYYLSSGGCKYGKACKYNHSRGKPAVAPVLEFNFLGLPIRPGERECPYYMRTGSCKYGSNCRFNHPDPTAAGGGDTPSRYGNGNGRSASLQIAPKTTMSSWSSPRAMNESTPFVPVMYPPTQGLPPPNPEWNGYQAPVYPTSETGLPTPPAFAVNNPPTDTTFYPHHQQQMQVEEYPERPGEPECGYFLKTGDCKYRSNCKFHHPRSRIPKTTPCVLSDKGLPLRPGQNMCTHYSRYGICKFGPACKYDHPVNYSNSTWSEGDQPPPFGNSVTADGLQ